MKNKFYKALSILMTLLIVFSVTVCAFTIVSAAEEEFIFYVSESGSDQNDGLTQTAALKTISAAISKAKAAGCDADDTVYAKICSFNGTQWGTQVDFDFNLVVTSVSDTRYYLSLPNNFKFGGDVSFENVMLDGSITNIYFNNHSVRFDNKCSFAINNYYLGNNNGMAATDSQTVVLGHALVGKSIWVGDNNKAKTYNDDVTLGINNATAAAKVMLGSSSGLTTFENNLNFNIMQSKTIDFEVVAGSINLNGALQVIVNSDTGILKEDKDHLASIEAPEGYYYITNATRVGGIIDFTETAGIYKVDTERYQVKATDKDGNEYIAKDGQLILPSAGEYVLTSVKDVENPVYYVSSEGDSKNDGLTPETPLSAINEVITAAVQAGYWEGDIVVVNVLSESVDWSNEFKINSTTEMVVDEYDYLLCVQSGNKSKISTVNFVYRQLMTGDVEFRDIDLNLGSKSGSRLFYANNHSVTFGENVAINVNTFAFGNFNSYVKFDGQSVVIKNEFKGKISLGNDGHHNSRTANEDVYLTLDNPKIKTEMYTTCYHGGTLAMKKNFNIQIKAAESAEFLRGSTVAPETITGIAVDGAIQLIANDDVILTQNSIDVLKACSGSGQFYYLSNTSGIKDLLEFTETAGKYKLNLADERCEIYAVDEAGNITTSENGYLVLPKSGEYIVDAKVTGITKEYYVGASGADGNNGLSAATPVATITRAFELAEDAGCVEGDTVVIKFVGSDFTFISPSVYKFNVKYTSATATRVKLNVDNSSAIANSVNAVTIFDNVKISFSDSWKSVILKNSNVIFTKNCTFSSYITVGCLTGNDGGSSTVATAQKVVFEGAMPYYIALSNTSWASVVRSGDVELVLDNASSDTTVRFNASYNNSANGITKYKNLNIDIKSIRGISFLYPQGVTVEGAIQIIDSQGLGITAQTLGIADITADKYIINNNTGNKDILAFTETAGQFVVDTDKYTVVATDEQNNTVTSQNGLLLLPTAGVYTLTLQHSHYYANDCDARCNSCNYERDNVHVYDNDCDEYCNSCTNMREIYHTYDNDCDKLCNVCYLYRATEHKFSSEVDLCCDGCGAIRSIKGALLFTEEDGTVYYYYDGVKSTATGLVEYEGKQMYINKGRFLGATGLVTVGGKKMYINKGYFLGASGLVTISGKKTYINKGYFTGASGLVTISGKKMYIRNGYFTGASGLVTISGKKMYINKGYFLGATGIVTINGKKHYINKGYFTGASGTVRVGGKTYKVVKGIVK